MGSPTVIPLPLVSRVNSFRQNSSRGLGFWPERLCFSQPPALTNQKLPPVSEVYLYIYILYYYLCIIYIYIYVYTVLSKNVACPKSTSVGSVKRLTSRPLGAPLDLAMFSRAFRHEVIDFWRQTQKKWTSRNSKKKRMIYVALSEKSLEIPEIVQDPMVVPPFAALKIIEDSGHSGQIRNQMTNATDPARPSSAAMESTKPFKGAGTWAMLIFHRNWYFTHKNWDFWDLIQVGIFRNFKNSEDLL